MTQNAENTNFYMYLVLAIDISLTMMFPRRGIILCKLPVVCKKNYETLFNYWSRICTSIDAIMQKSIIYLLMMMSSSITKYMLYNQNWIGFLSYVITEFLRFSAPKFADGQVVL